MNKVEKERLHNLLADISLIIERFAGCEITKREYLVSLQNKLTEIYKLC